MNFASLCVALLVVTGVFAEVTVEKGAFQNVLISFAPSIKTEDGRALLDKMQNAISEASLVLHNAIGFKIGSVTFAIPRTWDTSTWENVTIGAATPAAHSTASADVLVEETSDGAFGKFPSTLQYAGCGVPGHRISVPKDFLDSESEYPKGKFLAREWLKYRYGVFDENGYQGDEMYPAYYTVFGLQNEVRITSCTNTEVKYIFKDAKGKNCTLSEETGLPTNDECEVYPEEGTENITSSLMYFQEHLPEIEHICGDGIHKHDKTAPNKQNVLCQGKNIWDVVIGSTDFYAPMNEEEIADEEETTFSYVQEENPRVVLAFESSSRTAAKKEVIFSAIRRVLYDLPGGSQYALCSYQAGDPTVMQPLTQVQSWPDMNVNLFADFTSPADACSSCAIDKALDLLYPPNEENPSSGGFAVIIATSNPEENEEVLERLKKSKMCLIVIGLDDGATKEGFRNYLDASSCGGYWEALTADEDAKTFGEMFEAMETTVPSMIDDTITTTVLTENLEFGKQMKIPVDSTTGIISLWLTNFVNPSNIICKQDDEEVALTMPLRTEKLSAVQFNPTKATEVTCSLKLETAPPVLTQVRATTKPGEYFEMHAWVEDTTTKDAKKSKQQMPVIIYFNLKLGPYPVKGAEVEAVIKTPDGTEEHIQLHDDGRGDPDVTANDGVYSRYFISFDKEGEYAVSITAKDNGQATLVKNGREQCCGSEIIGDSVELGPFEKSFETSFTAVSGRPATGGYKPSRITDLRIAKVESTMVDLKWTAPGGEADNGTVTNYIIKSFTSLNDALQNFDNSAGSRTFEETINPQARGNIQTVTIQFTGEYSHNSYHYIAIKAVNSHNQTSETSNIKEVFISEGWTTTTPDEVTTATEDTPKSGPDKKIVGIIIGSIVGLIILVIIAYAAVYYFVLKPKRKEEKEARVTNNIINMKTKSSNEGNTLNPLNSIPADVLMKHHQEVVDAKNQHKNPPVFKGEDIEAQRSSANEKDNNNADNAEYSHNRPKEQGTSSFQPVPPKSPKRMTVV